MNSNPYRPPETAPQPEPAGTPTAMPIFVGVTVGMGLWYVVGSLSSLVFGWWLTLAGVPTAQLFQRFYTDAPFLACCHILTFLCMATGGFWATGASGGRRSAALISGLALTMFVVLQFATPYTVPYPGWSRLLSLLLPLPAYLVGARLHRRRAAPLPD